MSEPPPGAVLITNSTGRDGWTAADAAGDSLGAARGVAHAPSVTSAATRIAVVERLMCLAPPQPLRRRVAKGSHRRSDRNTCCHNEVRRSARGVRVAGPELVRQAPAEQGVWA